MGQGEQTKEMQTTERVGTRETASPERLLPWKAALECTRGEGGHYGQDHGKHLCSNSSARYRVTVGAPFDRTSDRYAPRACAFGMTYWAAQCRGSQIEGLGWDVEKRLECLRRLQGRSSGLLTARRRASGAIGQERTHSGPGRATTCHPVFTKPLNHTFLCTARRRQP